MNTSFPLTLSKKGAANVMSPSAAIDPELTVTNCAEKDILPMVSSNLPVIRAPQGSAVRLEMLEIDPDTVIHSDVTFFWEGGGKHSNYFERLTFIALFLKNLFLRNNAKIKLVCLHFLSYPIKFSYSHVWYISRKLYL